MKAPGGNNSYHGIPPFVRFYEDLADSTGELPPLLAFKILLLLDLLHFSQLQLQFLELALLGKPRFFMLSDLVFQVLTVLSFLLVG